MAIPLSRRSAASATPSCRSTPRGAASLTRPPRARSANLRSTVTTVAVQGQISARVLSETVAPLLRSFASPRSRLRRRRSHPSILEGRSSWGMRSRRHVSTAVTPVADRESLRRTPRGNRRTGRPGDDLVFRRVRFRGLTSSPLGRPRS